MIRKIIPILVIMAGSLFCDPASAQSPSQVVLPLSTDTGQVVYTAMGCSDDHNCTVVAQAGYNFDNPNPYHPYVERTTDGGLTWTRQSIPLPDADDQREKFPQTVYCIDSSNIYLIGDSGLILRTTDAGADWINESYPQALGTMFPCFVDSAHGIIAGGGGLLIQTSDAGNTWQPISVLPFQSFNSPKMFSTDSFFVFENQLGKAYYISQNGLMVDTSKMLFNPYADTGYTYLSSISWVGQAQEGIGTGVRFHNFGTDSEECLVLTTKDGGNSWDTSLDRDTKQWSGMGAFSALPNGTAMFGGSNNPNWLDWTNNWHGTQWLEDSINAPFGAYEITGISLLDSSHALIMLDDATNNGATGPAAAVGWVERITLNAQASVKTGQQNISDVQIYPNPASSSITITSAEAGSAVHLLDILGREVMQGTVPANGPLTLDVGSLPAGMYYISDGQTRAKFVKE